MAKAHIAFFFLNCTNLKKRGAHLQCVYNHIFHLNNVE